MAMAMARNRLQANGQLAVPRTSFRRLIEREGETFAAWQPLCSLGPGPGPLLVLLLLLLLIHTLGVATGSHYEARVLSLKIFRLDGRKEGRMKERNPGWKAFIVNSSPYYLAWRCRRVEIFMHWQSFGPAIINVRGPFAIIAPKTWKGAY